MDTPIIPGYDILAPLPQGGMSAVFKARQISLDRVVVLKILPPAMAADAVDIEKLMTEAKITAQLKHPNIVQVYDFGKTPDGIYYFVMEFISGYSVAEWIRRKKNLSIMDTLLCAHCVAEALSYAWETFGVVHCDIKPDNVMIDGDGTVKVADLGLARSVRSVMDKAKFQAGVVVGTPYYISPEQSQGRCELDCRADIYSLGAMLYHCLTGKMPFEGLPLLEIMDRQITDQIPDIMELQPHLSMAVACLIEKMMAKDPDHRQKDWPEVVRDMISARSGILPEGPLPPEGASTMRRCAARGQYLKEIDALAHAGPVPQPLAAAPVAPLAGSMAWSRQWIEPKWLAAVIIVIALGVSALLVVNMRVKPKRAAPPTDSLPGSAGTGTAALPGIAPASRPDEQATGAGQTGNVSGADMAKMEALAKEETLARHRLEAALQWCQANPGQYDKAIRRFEKIAAQSKDTRYAQAAEDEIARIREQKRAALAADMQALRDSVQPLLDGQKWREAATLFEQYAGPFKDETETERKAQVREWLDRDRSFHEEMRQAAETRKQEQNRQWHGLLDEIAAHLVEGNSSAALDVVRQSVSNDAFSVTRNDLQTLASMLAEANRADQSILDSFRSQKDQEVVVVLARGPERLVVRGVRGDTILAEKIVVVSAGQIGQSKTIRLQDLSTKEKQARLGTGAMPDTFLAQGLVALRDGNWVAAETSWRQAGPLLAAPLLTNLQKRKDRQLENQARNDFSLLLRAAQVERVEPLPGGEECVAAIYQKKYSPQMAKALAKSVAGYQSQYGRTEFARAYAPVLTALKQAVALASDSEKNGRAGTAPRRPVSAAALNAAVCRDLFVLNPGLTEYNVSLVPDRAGKIVRAELIGLDLKDISPLASLPDLRELVCSVMRPEARRESSLKAPLSDLTPLKGLPLRELDISHTRVKDLAPLAGLPLTRLNLTGTRVMDLSALKGMPLRELTLTRLRVRDLKPLAGLPLEFLDISHTEVLDLAPLSGMKLKRLIATASRIRDISVLEGMPLTELISDRTEVSNLAPLAGMQLKHLDLSQTRVRELTPLAGMPLRRLNLSQTPVRDLSPLQNIALETLNVRATQVNDLEPLRKMPLNWLDISNTDVRDLAPLAGMPLRGLVLWKTAVRDLTPIKILPIEEIWLDYNADEQPPTGTYRAFTTVLMRMPRLQKVNGNSDFRERRRRE